MAKKSKKRRTWTATEVRGLKAMAKTKTPATKIAKTLKRTEGATWQKAFSIGLSLESRLVISVLIPIESGKYPITDEQLLSFRTLDRRIAHRFGAILPSADSLKATSHGSMEPPMARQPSKIRRDKEKGTLQTRAFQLERNSGRYTGLILRRGLSG